MQIFDLFKGVHQHDFDLCDFDLNLNQKKTCHCPNDKGYWISAVSEV